MQRGWRGGGGGARWEGNEEKWNAKGVTQREQEEVAEKIGGGGGGRKGEDVSLREGAGGGGRV